MVGLIVIHFFLSLVLTVANALPAYIGRIKISGLLILIISLTWDISNKAATLGIKFFPNVLADAIIWVYFSANFTTKGVKFYAK